MALVKCPECGRENVSDTAEACPNCGFAIRDYFSKAAEESGVPVQPEESSNNEPSDKRRNKKSTSYYCTYCGTQVDDIPIYATAFLPSNHAPFYVHILSQR